MSRVETTGADVGVSSEDREMADAMSGIINTPRKSTFEKRGDIDGWLPKLDLPGFGEEDDTCGEEIPHFCDGCGHSFPVGRTCAKSTCPRCGASWVMKRAGTSRENSGGATGDGEDKPGHVAMLDAVSRLKSSRSGGKSIKWHHVVFSPPMDSWFLEAEDPLQRTFHVIRDLMKLWDAEGYVYYHPWAGDNEDHEGDDRDEWSKRLFSNRDWEGDVKDELIPRGHFHAVIAAEWVPGGDVTRLVHEQTDWVIKRIAKRDGTGSYSIKGLDQLARTVTYSLSHTGIDTSGERNQAAFRRYGSTFDDVENCPRKDEADDWVRSVAKTTLGVPLNDVKCLEEVPEDEACDHNDADHLPDDVEDGAGDDTDTTEEVDAPDMVPCNGHVRSIDEADRFLENPKWRAQARHADELQTTFEEWEDGDGYPGG